MAGWVIRQPDVVATEPDRWLYYAGGGDEKPGAFVVSSAAWTRDRRQARGFSTEADALELLERVRLGGNRLPRAELEGPGMNPRRASRGELPSGDLSTAHKGFSIRHNVIRGEFYISKEGQHIATATSLEDAKRTIDEYLVNPGGGDMEPAKWDIGEQVAVVLPPHRHLNPTSKLELIEAAAGGHAQKITESVGGKQRKTYLDMQSANAILTVYRNLSPANQEKYLTYPVSKMADIAWKLLAKRNPPRWRYQDARGVWREGIVDQVFDRGGTDVTYKMRRDDGTIDMLSGSRLKAAEVIYHKHNAGRGRRMTFHGAFGTKAAAVRKEHRVRGGFIQPRTIKGEKRYLVMSENPWATYAGGTGAHHGHSYDIRGEWGEYHVTPPQTRHGDYALMWADTKGLKGGGLWHHLGRFRSPGMAKSAARKHARELGYTLNPPLGFGRPAGSMRTRRPSRRYTANDDGGWDWSLLIVIGGVAMIMWLMGKGNVPSAAASPALTMGGQAIWFSDPSTGGDASIFVGSLPPGSQPPWRHALASEQTALSSGAYSAAGGGLYVPTATAVP